MTRGWRREPRRHAMAAKGLKTTWSRIDRSVERHARETGRAMSDLVARGESRFFGSDTGIPVQQNMMDNPEYFREKKGIAWKIVWMSPDEYEAAIKRGFEMEEYVVRGKDTTIVSRLPLSPPSSTRVRSSSECRSLRLLQKLTAIM